MVAGDHVGSENEGQQQALEGPGKVEGQLEVDLRTLLGTRAAPQLVLRFGHPAGEVPQTPRRSVEEVLEEW